MRHTFCQCWIGYLTDHEPESLLFVSLIFSCVQVDGHNLLTDAETSNLKVGNMGVTPLRPAWSVLVASYRLLSQQLQVSLRHSLAVR